MSETENELNDLEEARLEWHMSEREERIRRLKEKGAKWNNDRWDYVDEDGNSHFFDEGGNSL